MYSDFYIRGAIYLFMILSSFIHRDNIEIVIIGLLIGLVSYLVGALFGSENKILKVITLLIEGTMGLFLADYLGWSSYSITIITLVEFLYILKVKTLFSLIAVIILIIFISDENAFSILIPFALASYFLVYRTSDMRNRLLYLEEQNENYRQKINELNYEIGKEEEIRAQYINLEKLSERNKLSISMHDKVGHTISGAIMQLEATKIIIDSNYDKGLCMIDNTINLLSKGMDDIRHTLKEIKPTNEDMGINKIKLLLEEKTKGTNFKYSLMYKGDLDKVKKLHWITIYEVTMEFSTNTLKHSCGNKIDVSLEVLNKLIKISLKDNGEGCQSLTKGMGLQSMEEKVADANGKTIFNTDGVFEVIIIFNI